MAGLIEPCGRSLRLTQGTNGASDDIHVESDPSLSKRRVSVRSGKAEGAKMPHGNIPLAILVIRVGGVFDKGDVSQLRRQQVSPQDAFSVMEILRVAPTSQDERGFENIPRIVYFAEI